MLRIEGRKSLSKIKQVQALYWSDGQVRVHDADAADKLCAARMALGSIMGESAVTEAK